MITVVLKTRGNNIINVLMIMPVVGDPRETRRILMLQQQKFQIEAIAFRRDYYSGITPNCKISYLCRIANGKYFSRLLKILSILPKVRKAITRNHVVYASGIDMAYMAVLAGMGLKKPVILEVGDILDIQLASGVTGQLMRALDRYFVNKCSLLVATAKGFIEEYYRKMLNTKIPAIIIENKLDTKFSVNLLHSDHSPYISHSNDLAARPLRIGYFGVLRCKWSLLILKALAKALPGKVEIILAGYSMLAEDLHNLGFPNIRYLGHYKSPQDLPWLYDSVDIVWACYKHKKDLSWARSNRFYESCYFQKPLVARKGSGDAVEIDKYGIGLILDRDNEADIIRTFCSLHPSLVLSWQKNMQLLPKSVYLYTSEYEHLERSILDLLGY